MSYQYMDPCESASMELLMAEAENKVHNKDIKLYDYADPFNPFQLTNLQFQNK